MIFLPILHCQCYTDCRIDGNKIRVLEEDRDKCGGYNLPVVQMNNNEPDIYESEATIIGDVPKGKRAGDKIKLIIDGYNGAIGPSGKTLTPHTHTSGENDEKIYKLRSRLRSVPQGTWPRHDLSHLPHLCPRAQCFTLCSLLV